MALSVDAAQAAYVWRLVRHDLLVIGSPAGQRAAIRCQARQESRDRRTQDVLGCSVNLGTIPSEAGEAAPSCGYRSREFTAPPPVKRHITIPDPVPHQPGDQHEIGVTVIS
jgi:hypothetical protein